MADRMTKEQRHKCMSHIRSKDTRPELLVRKALFAAGFRFRVNVSSLPGTPDIVLRKYNTAIFVNGCFWHGHPGCRLYTVPKSNTRFWQEKVEKNQRRDAAVALRLEARGWNVITVWECSLDSSHRQDTIASLVLQIRENGRKARLESAERRERLEAARKEAADRRVRRSDLEEEISKIYDIPARIRRASVADGDPILYGQDDYDDSASDRN